MGSLVLLRHGQSEWNQDDRFAGWVDIPLTPLGVEQARKAGIFMRQHRLDFDACYTSVLKRATHTAWHCLDAMERTWLPTVHSWRLNERHYGALHGLSKLEMASQFGDEQVRRWRRSYSTRPPAASAEDCARFGADPRYAGVEVPASESMADTVARLRPFWSQAIRPALNAGARTLVVAHGTSLRALIKILCNVSATEIASLEIPNGVPLVTEVDKGGRAHYPSPLYD